MEKIGVRELKNQASGIVRRVREESAEYVITHHGTPVAILKQIDEEEIAALNRKKNLEIFERLLEIGAELERNAPPGGKTAREHLEEMREEQSRWPL